VKEVRLFEEIRIIHIPKKLIFEEVKRKGVLISLSSFYLLTQKIKKPKRRTDCCELCKRGRFLELKKGKCEEGEELSNSEMNELLSFKCDEILYKESQKSIQKKEENMNEGEGILVFDYKESWNTRVFLGDETSWDHWHPNTISHIAYVLIWKENGERKKRVYNYLSENKKHNAKFSIQTMKMLTQEKEMEKISKLSLYCDVGPHFYNKYIIHQIFNTNLFGERNVALTFFCEHHGKSYCDSSFGTLTQAVTQCLPLPQIQSCTDLIAFFNEIKKDQSQCFEKIKNEHIFKEYVFNYVKKFMNNFFKIHTFRRL
jgi:hypothetical protein